MASEGTIDHTHGLTVKCSCDIYFTSFGLVLFLLLVSFFFVPSEHAEGNLKPTVSFLKESQVHESTLTGKEVLDLLLAGDLEVLGIAGKVESTIRPLH